MSEYDGESTEEYKYLFTKKKFEEILNNANAREARIIRERFSHFVKDSSGPEQTRKECIVTRDRINEIEERALQKLKNKNN